MNTRFKTVFWSSERGIKVTFYDDFKGFFYAVDWAKDYLTRNTDCYVIGITEAEEDDSEAWKDEG